MILNFSVLMLWLDTFSNLWIDKLVLPLHNDIQHSDTQHKDTQHKDTQHKDTQHKDIQHNNKSIATQSCVMPNVLYA